MNLLLALAGGALLLAGVAALAIVAGANAPRPRSRPRPLEGVIIDPKDFAGSTARQRMARSRAKATITARVQRKGSDKWEELELVPKRNGGTDG